jgi:hypothetical protein
VTAIGNEEVVAGLVAFLDPEVLAADDGVVTSKDPRRFRSGPFVCISVGAEHSTWTPLTTEERHERLAIRREWRSGGHPQWLASDQFLTDGVNVWDDATAVFVSASHQEVTTESNRARISAEGLAAIEDAVRSQQHRRDR